MMETDDKLIKEFMSAAAGPIKDDGFTRRVMLKLPQRNNVLLMAGGILLFVALIVIFFISGAASGVIMMLRDLIVSAVKNGTLLADLRTALILIICIITFCIQRVTSMS